MTDLRLALVLLPLLVTVTIRYALRPRPQADVPAATRLGLMRAALVVGVISVVAIEALSAARAVAVVPIVGFWVAALAVSLGLAWLRHRYDRGYPEEHASGPARWRGAWTALTRLTRGERAVAMALVGLLALELVLALAASPNNYDSYYYHLSKVENWVAHRSVEPYPTVLLPQVILAPGAEYLLLHLRLLVGGDALYNLVQWCAGVGCTVAVSRIAGQLGAGRFGQLCAAVAVASTPMIVLQSTSTQTDLTCAAWVTVTASLVIDELRVHRGAPNPAARGWRAALGALAIGAGAGMTAVTKSTGLLCLAPLLLLWAGARLRPAAGTRLRVPAGARLRRLAAVVGAAAVAGLLAVLMAGVVVGPFALRTDRTFGDPLGGSAHRGGLTLQRHDPATLLVNALRIGSSTLFVPVPAVNRAISGTVLQIATALGVDPQDPRTTLAYGRYPDTRWWPDEDHSPFPLQSVLILCAVLAAVGVRRVPGLVRCYGLTVLTVMVAYASVLKWQLWGNRLVVPAVVLATPLVGWWAGRLAERWTAREAGRVTVSQRLVAGAVATALLLGFAGAYHAVLWGWPRRLVGHDSVFTLSDWQERFVRQPDRAGAYRFAAAAVISSGAHRVGVVTRGDNWDYPWWLLLPGRELVSMESQVPGAPAPGPVTVDAVVCAAPSDMCMVFAPPGTRYVSSLWPIGAAVPVGPIGR